jgi:hypothetical protein
MGSAVVSAGGPTQVFVMALLAVGVAFGVTDADVEADATDVLGELEVVVVAGGVDDAHDARTIASKIAPAAREMLTSVMAESSSRLVVSLPARRRSWSADRLRLQNRFNIGNGNT